MLSIAMRSEGLLNQRVGTHAVSVGNIRDRDVVLILGSGVIGLCLIAAREEARTALVSDLSDSRLRFAKSLGDPVQEVQRSTSEKGADAVIEAVGLEQSALKVVVVP